LVHRFGFLKKKEIMGNYPKHIKKELRQLADLLYERELNEALSRLDAFFAAWREEKISPFLLSKKIHEFHQGEARELYVKYVLSKFEDLLVARGMVSGQLKEGEVKPEVREAVQHLVDNFAAELEEE
jgi:hypothetical protein